MQRLEGELPQQPAGELAIGGRQGRSEQLERPAEVRAPLAGPAEPEVRLAELPLPAGSPQPVLRRAAAGQGGLVQRERLGEEQRSLPIALAATPLRVQW